MEVIIIFNIVILTVLTTATVVYLSMRRQKDAVLDEVHRLALRVAQLELVPKAELNAGQPQSRIADKTDAAGQEAPNNHNEQPSAVNRQTEATRIGLSSMNDEELFAYMSKVIQEEELFRWPDFNRTAVMEHFSLSAARIGNAFVRGGGVGLPEFVRNCRLDFACRMMVEQPDKPFADVIEASGYQRSTTFYHDFKARFGMTPADYRAKELRVES